MAACFATIVENAMTTKILQPDSGDMRKTAIRKLIEMTPPVRKAVLEALVKKRQAAKGPAAQQPNLDQDKHDQWLAKQSDAQLDKLAKGLGKLARLKEQRGELSSGDLSRDDLRNR